MSIDNCKKCSKIFQKRLTDVCTECLQKSEEEFRLVYRILQRSGTSGGIAIEELSHETNVSVDEIEEFYLEGRLSTAGNYLKFQCQTCGVLVGAMQRKGRFCNPCSEKTATEAGVEIKSKQELEKREKEAMKRQEQQNLLSKIRADRSTGSSRRSGFARRSR